MSDKGKIASGASGKPPPRRPVISSIASKTTTTTTTTPLKKAASKPASGSSKTTTTTTTTAASKPASGSFKTTTGKGKEEQSTFPKFGSDQKVAQWKIEFDKDPRKEKLKRDMRKDLITSDDNYIEYIAPEIKLKNLQEPITLASAAYEKNINFQRKMYGAPSSSEIVLYGTKDVTGIGLKQESQANSGLVLDWNRMKATKGSRKGAMVYGIDEIIKFIKLVDLKYNKGGKAKGEIVQYALTRRSEISAAVETLGGTVIN